MLDAVEVNVLVQADASGHSELTKPSRRIKVT